MTMSCGMTCTRRGSSSTSSILGPTPTGRWTTPHGPGSGETVGSCAVLPAGGPTDGIQHVLKPTRLFEKNVDIGDEMPYVCQEDRLRHLADLLGFSEHRCCLGFTEVAAGTFFFTLEDVFTEGALEQDRDAAGGFRLISGGRDREAIDGENLGSP